MQQIERYGVIALVFLLVTIVAVSFWGDSKSPGFWSRLTGKAKKAEVAQTEPLADPNAPMSATGMAGESTLPLTQTDPTKPIDPGTGSQLVGGNLQVPVATPPSGPTVPVQIESIGPPAAPTGTKVDAPAPGASYVVKKGDTLGLIAARTLGSANRWTEISALNSGLEPKNLRVGATLRLPATADLSQKTPSSKSPSSTAPATTTKPAPKSAPKSSGATYVVQKGDSLRSIASKKLGDSGRWKEISAANPGLNNKLLVGKAINLPADAHPALVAAAMGPSSASTFDALDKPRVR